MAKSFAQTAGTAMGSLGRAAQEGKVEAFNAAAPMALRPFDIAPLHSSPLDYRVGCMSNRRLEGRTYPCLSSVVLTPLPKAAQG